MHWPNTSYQRSERADGEKLSRSRACANFKPTTRTEKIPKTICEENLIDLVQNAGAIPFLIEKERKFGARGATYLRADTADASKRQSNKLNRSNSQINEITVYLAPRDLWKANFHLTRRINVRSPKLEI